MSLGINSGGGIKDRQPFMPKKDTADWQNAKATLCANRLPIMDKPGFCFTRQPFPLVPDRECYFPAGSAEKARQNIESAVQHSEGMSLLFGESGAGKTLLLHRLRQSFETEYRTTFINGRIETPKALFSQLFHHFPIAGTDEETVLMRLQFLDFVRQEPAAGFLLLIDEAQYLSLEVLEELRFLTDSADGCPSKCCAVLAGTSGFEENLAHPQLTAFCQRIMTRCYLEPFTAAETDRYITEQTGELPVFTDEAKRQIHLFTEGIPRLINQLCRAALETAERTASSPDVQAVVTDAGIRSAWAELQHIAETDISAEMPKLLTPPEEIDEIVKHKKHTFLLRQFDTLEFGTLDEHEAEPPPANSAKKTEIKLRVHGGTYKPAYPEGDEDEPEETAVPAISFADQADQTVPLRIKPEYRRLILNYVRCDRKIRRKDVLQKVLHRLGMFVGLLMPKKTEPVSAALPATGIAPCNIESEMGMDTNALAEYGAAVLENRPRFIRKEPGYAYQTTETVPETAGGTEYPDPQTGTRVVLNWHRAENDSDRIGISYSEFLKQKEKQEIPVRTLIPLPVPPLATPKQPAANVLRASLHALPVDAEPQNRLDETFDNAERVSGTAVPLADLFRTDCPALPPGEPRAGKSEELQKNGTTVQMQLLAVMQRILQAAEKIEQAAEVSERAGKNINQSAKLVETEVKNAVPAYLGFFKELSDLQQTLSAELESIRNQTEAPRVRMFPRRHIEIERKLPVIGVELLLK
ncbi:MAG: AAA family ATPase [Planctomycetaceae bacterium]|nr:AAA family ATPase [Planctomycetaceae bacterium]